MNAGIEYLGLWLADFYLAATILLTIAAILFTVIRQPAPRMAVGWGSLLGLLIAAGLCLSPSRPRFDLRPFFTRSETPVAETESARVPIASPPVVETAAPRPDSAEELAFDRFEPPQSPVEQSVRTDAPTTEPVSSAPPAVAWGPRFAALAVGSFLAGLITMASWLVVGVLRASRLVQRSAPAPDGCCDELRKIAGRAARLPRLRMHRRLVMPVATGTLRPAILLPQGFAEAGSRNALRAVLAHEWTHIKNGDLWLLAVDRLVLSLLWAHPLYWWTRRRIRTNQELLADAAAASQIGPTDYAAFLVEWARNLAAHRGPTALTAVGIWERPAALELRVTALLTHSDGSPVRTAGRTRLGIAAAMATLSLFVATLSLRPPQRVLADAQPQPVASLKSASDESNLNAAKPIQAIESRPTSSGVSGGCRDKDGKPLAGVTVSLYAMQTATGRRQLLRETTTDRAGQFVLSDCLGPKTVQLAWGICDADGAAFELFAHKPGLATDVKTVTERDEQLEFTLTKAASLTGTVRDPEGKPIVDAWLHVGTAQSPRNGRLCARSDRQGRFVITDLAENEFAVRADTSWPPDGILSVEHPAYGSALASFKKIPGEVDVVLKKAAAIEGTVVYGNSGKPAVGISVTANWIDEPYAYMSSRMPVATTDKQGRYRLFPLPEGQFNICASLEPVDKVFSDSVPKEFVATSVDSFQSRAGQSSTAPPIRLVKGGIVKGRLVQYRPGVNGVRDPVRLDPGVRLMLIAFRGAALPGPGAVADAEFVKEDGTFEMRLPPGLHSLQLPNNPRADGTYRLPYADMGEPSTEEDAARPLNGLHKVKIKEGETTEIEISVFRPKPPEQPKTDAKKTVTENVSPSKPAEAPRSGNAPTAQSGISGVCVDRDNGPVTGAQVSLYRVSFVDFTQRLVEQSSTDAAGRYRFVHGSAETNADGCHFVVVVRKDGLTTVARPFWSDEHDLKISMPPGVTMRGVVRNQQGAPVADALVAFGSGRGVNYLPRPTEGIRSARTNARGQFVVSDLDEFHYAPSEPPPNWHGVWASFGPPSVQVIHRDYVQTRVTYKDRPGQIDVVLSAPPGIIEGRVVFAETGKAAAGVTVLVEARRPTELIRETAETDREGRYRVSSLPQGRFSVWVSHAADGKTAETIESLNVTPGQTEKAPLIRLMNGGVIQGQVVDDRTGRPAAGITLGLQGAQNQKGKVQGFSGRATTDAKGEYRFAGLPPGKFNVYYNRDRTDVTAAAIASFEVRAGQTAEAPVMHLIPGCLIKGRIIDDATGKQLTLRDGEYLDLQSQGPAKPSSGAGVDVAVVRKDGTFEIRMPPGDSWLAVRANSTFLGRGRTSFNADQNSGGDLQVPESGELKVEYHVRRYIPPKAGAGAPPEQSETAARRAPRGTKIVDRSVAKDEIGGTCMTRDELRLAGVEVSLYITSFGGQAHDSGPKLVDKTTTDDQGQFVFRRVPQLDPGDRNYLVLARQPGRATVSGTLNHRHDWLDLKMWWPTPFKGTVKDADGKPVAGALVRCDDSANYELPEGIQSARTNARGEFEIDDVVGRGNCVIEHPEYARRTLQHLSFNDVAELKVSRGGVVEGQVLDTVTGNPAAGLSVHMQPISRPWPIDDAALFSASAKTDGQGRYRIGSIPTGKFNVYVSSVPGRASVALDSLAVTAGQVVPAPPIRLVKGGLVQGRLIDNATGQPAPVAEGERVTIGAYGPSRPPSGAAIEGFAVKTDGTFELRLPPGKNSVYLSGGPFLVRKPGDPYASQDIREISVKEGQETTIEFRVTRQAPMKKAPANSTKKSPVPASGAASRSAPIAVAEAPNFSPKIVDYQVGKDEIAGLCIGQGEARLAAVDVSLYVDRFGGAVEQRSQRLFGTTTTNTDGQFLFQHVPQVNPRAERFFVIAHRLDLATALESLDHRHDWVELKMRASHVLKGTVKDTHGHPVADALVRCDQSTFYKLPEGLQSARTNARGEFEIDDVSGVGRCIVEHSGYPRKVLNGPEITDSFDIILDKRSAAIEGRVMSETGDSVAGLIIGLQGIDGQNEHARRFYSQTTTDQEGRYQLRALPPGKFNVCVMSSLREGVCFALDSIEVGPDQKTQAPALRIVKGGVVKGRLIDDATGGAAVLGKDERVSIGVHGPSRPRSGGGIEAFPVKSDGSFEMRLPPGKTDVFVMGGDLFFVRDADNHYGTQSFQVVDVKAGEEATIEFHVLRDAPAKKAPERATRKSPTPSSAAESRPAPVAVAEAPNVSPKIVDYHLARSMKRKNAAPEQRSEIVRPSPEEVLGYLPANVAKWLASGPPTNRDRMRVTVEPAIDRTGECRFYPLVGKARLQQCVFKCSVALDKVPHADAPLDIQETIKAPLVFYMQQNHLICCDDSVAQR